MWRRLSAVFLFGAFFCVPAAPAHTGKVWFSVKTDPDKRLSWFTPILPIHIAATQDGGRKVKGVVECSVSSESHQVKDEQGRDATVTVTVFTCGDAKFRVYGIHFEEQK
jgi:hypothetical protein